MDLLQQIEDLVCGNAELSESENRIYVKFSGIRTASKLKEFMFKNGFDYVYGAYEDGVYELGFSNSGLS